MTTTDKLIAKVRRLDAAATPGPWVVRSQATTGLHFIDEIDSAQGRCAVFDDDEERNGGNNAALIAEYRTAAPALADAVERLATAIGELPAVRGMPPGKHYVEVDIDIIDHLFGLAIECGAKLERRST